MRVAVVGNQEGWSYEFIKSILFSLKVTHEDTIISGGAKGVDTFAQEYAKEVGCSIIIHYPKPHIPSPERYFQRNKDVTTDCDYMVAFDKKSGAAGTKNTIRYANEMGKRVIVFKDDKEILEG